MEIIRSDGQFHSVCLEFVASRHILFSRVLHTEKGSVLPFCVQVALLNHGILKKKVFLNV